MIHSAEFNAALRHIAILLSISDRGHIESERFLEEHGAYFDGRRWQLPGEEEKCSEQKSG